MKVTRFVYYWEMWAQKNVPLDILRSVETEIRSGQQIIYPNLGTPMGSSVCKTIQTGRVRVRAGSGTIFKYLYRYR